MTTPLIIAYYDGDSEVQELSNFAHTPFVMDGDSFNSVEGFWQMLKTDDYKIRVKFHGLDGLDAKQLGKRIQQKNKTTFIYAARLYNVGSQEHHQLLELAIRAKVEFNKSVRTALLKTGNRPLLHRLRTARGWKVANSPALPAKVFEDIWTRIREELQTETFMSYYDLPLPMGINQVFEIEE